MNQVESIEKLKKEYAHRLQNTIVGITNNQELTTYQPLIVEKKMKEVHSKLELDIEGLFQETVKTLEQENQVSDNQLKIQLLTKIAQSKKSKFLRKLAQELLEEKWWQK